MSWVIKIWSWVKLNAVMFAIFAAVLTFCVAMAYLQGRADSKAHCDAEKAKGFAAVNAELLRIREADEAQSKAWDKQNELTAAALDARVTDTYRVVEKIIEKPVPVTGDCDIGYELVELLNAAATPDGN